jgi:hypothetical protein
LTRDELALQHVADHDVASRLVLDYVRVVGEDDFCGHLDRFLADDLGARLVALESGV